MLQINQVSKHYKNMKALNQISLTIPTGICYGLVGPNGAGKSTLMKIIADIIQADNGNLLWNEIKLDKSMKCKIGYVPQEICLEQTVSALQNLYLFGKLYGLKGKILQQRAEEVLSYIGLTDRKKDKVSTFSGGMKRRLNIGCALMNQPTTIIMDEPTVGIDPQSRHYIFDMITQLKEQGCTILYASHYMEEVEQICDKVAFIDQGKVIEMGDIESLLKKYSTPSIYVKGEQCLPNKIKQFSTSAKHNGGYVVTSEHPLLVMEEILQYCRKNNRHVERLELIQPRLEDVFFSLTGNQLRD